jgi:hypothetical protein
MVENLKDLVAAELAEPVDPRVSAMAAAIAALYPGAARACSSTDRAFASGSSRG